jgi:hypothetical protein
MMLTNFEKGAFLEMYRRLITPYLHSVPVLSLETHMTGGSECGSRSASGNGHMSCPRCTYDAQVALLLLILQISVARELV